MFVLPGTSNVEVGEKSKETLRDAASIEIRVHLCTFISPSGNLALVSSSRLPRFRRRLSGEIHRHLGPVSQKSRKLFGSKKPFVWNCQPLVLESRSFNMFSRKQKEKMTVKFDDLNPPRSWDTEGIVTPENGSQSVETFEKRPPPLPPPRSAFHQSGSFSMFYFSTIEFVSVQRNMEWVIQETWLTDTWFHIGYKTSTSPYTLISYDCVVNWLTDRMSQRWRFPRC